MNRWERNVCDYFFFVFFLCRLFVVSFGFLRISFLIIITGAFLATMNRFFVCADARFAHISYVLWIKGGRIHFDVKWRKSSDWKRRKEGKTKQRTSYNVQIGWLSLSLALSKQSNDSWKNTKTSKNWWRKWCRLIYCPSDDSVQPLDVQTHTHTHSYDNNKMLKYEKREPDSQLNCAYMQSISDYKRHTEGEEHFLRRWRYAACSFSLSLSATTHCWNALGSENG